MTPTKLLIGQILVAFGVTLLGVWTATQWAAAMLAYQPELGSPWLIVVGRPLYRPWALFAWWYHFDAYAPHVFDKAGSLAGASGFAGCSAAIAGSLWRARQRRNVTTYGSARWATAGEITRAGLHGHAGILLGRSATQYLRHGGPEHVLAFAPMPSRFIRGTRERCTASTPRLSVLPTLPCRPARRSSRSQPAIPRGGRSGTRAAALA